MRASLKSLNNVRYSAAASFFFHNFSSNFQTTFTLFDIVTQVTCCFHKYFSFSFINSWKNSRIFSNMYIKFFLYEPNDLMATRDFPGGPMASSECLLKTYGHLGFSRGGPIASRVGSYS